MSYNKKLCYNDLTNHEGAKAWRLSPEWELYTTVVTTMAIDDKFYESGDDRVRRIADLMRKVDPEFVAQLAVYAREEMNLRSVPLLLLVELANCHNGDSLVSRAVSRTMQRADEIAELLMCYQWRTGKKNLQGLSSQLRRGLAEAFNSFDEYQFAKYDRTNRKVTLRDALQLVHPKPKDEAQAEIFRKILNGTLATPYTWETELSEAGKQKFSSWEEHDNAMRDKWQRLIMSGCLGYMAMLRNLRNMVNLCIDDESKDMVCQRLSDEDAVRRSRQLPFRFLSAYMQLVEDYYPTSQKPIKDMDYWRPIQFALSSKHQDIRQQLARLRKGYGKVRYTPSIHRYRQVGTLAYVAKQSGVNIKVPTWHVRRLKQHRCRKNALSGKELLRLQKLEKQLEHIAKRLAAIEPKCTKEANRNTAFRIKALESYERQKKNYLFELHRRDNRMAALGTNKPMFVKPIQKALEKAVRYTADNIKGFDKNTRVLLASDVSGSMFMPVSENSTVMCYHIGLLMSMMMRYKCDNVVTGMFGDIWKTYEFKSDNILQNTLDMMSHEGEVGYSTNGYKVIDWLIDEQRVIDKVMLFTDCELWDNTNRRYSLSGSWARYKRIAPDAKLYLFNLAGYGTSPVSMKHKDVFCIAGWSDKVFDVLAALEDGKNAIDTIRRIVV